MPEKKETRLYGRIKSLKHQVAVLWFVLAILLIVIIAGIIIVLGNQAQIMTMQTDTLDQIMEVRQMDPVEETEPVEPTSTLTPDEFDLVCRVVMSESGGEDLQGQMAVAQTILDRSELWNMTPSEVVQAPGQYADPYQGEISDEIHLAVANVFDGGVRVFNEPTTHFYSGPEPYWADDKINRGSVGRHQFCY